MLNSTTNTYTLKREILTFSKKISKHVTVQTIVKTDEI